MSTRIVSDSSCDLWTLDGMDFVTVPLTISTSEKTYVDDENLDIHEMLDYLAHYKGRSFTACPGTTGWLQAFEGADEIFVLTLTSGLSGTYNAASTAAEIFRDKHPEAKVHVIDTLTTSTEMALMIDRICELKKAGQGFEAICTAIDEYRKTTRLFFAFESLHNFAQNGRVPKLLAQAVGVLGISILGTASEAGTVEPLTKCRGKGAVIRNMISLMTKAGYAGGRVRISHVENEAFATQLAEAIKKEFPAVTPIIYPSRGLVAYYGERGGVIIGCEC